MMIDGIWVNNITCKYCRHRHPESITCGEARKIAQRTYDERAAAQKIAAERRAAAAAAEAAELEAALERAKNLQYGRSLGYAYSDNLDLRHMAVLADEVARLREYKAMHEGPCE